MAIGDKKPVLMKSDIGAEGGVAPAGYGLGNDWKTTSDPSVVDTFQRCGWARYVNDGGISLVPGFDILYGSIRIDAYSTNNYVVQTLYPISFRGSKLERFLQSNGIWSQWEWVNPPMTSGVEYRTTERYKGKPVYVKLLNMGSMPAKATTSPEHGIPNIAECVRAHHVMVATKNNGRFGLPFMTSSLTVTASFSNTNVVIYDSGEHADHVCMSTLYYTKTTDN